MNKLNTSAANSVPIEEVSPTSVSAGENNGYEKLRKKILIFYELGLIASFLFAFMSIFVFLDPNPNNTFAVAFAFFSMASLPFFILASMTLSKKSLKWFLLPLIPIAIFIISSMIQ